MERLVEFLVDIARKRVENVTGPQRPRLDEFVFDGEKFCQSCRDSSGDSEKRGAEFARLMIVAHDLELIRE